jgi:hypothetical protein
MRFPFDILPVEWDEKKNRMLQRTRGVSFQDVEEALNDETNILDVLPHPNRTLYPHQSILVVIIRNYACAVPFVYGEKKIFLKTVYKSRKFHEKYLSN